MKTFIKGSNQLFKIIEKFVTVKYLLIIGAFILCESLNVTSSVLFFIKYIALMTNTILLKYRCTCETWNQLQINRNDGELKHQENSKNINKF